MTMTRWFLLTFFVGVLASESSRHSDGGDERGSRHHPYPWHRQSEEYDLPPNVLLSEAWEKFTRDANDYLTNHPGQALTTQEPSKLGASYISIPITIPAGSLVSGLPPGESATGAPSPEAGATATGSTQPAGASAAPPASQQTSNTFQPAAAASASGSTVSTLPPSQSASPTSQTECKPNPEDRFGSACSSLSAEASTIGSSIITGTSIATEPGLTVTNSPATTDTVPTTTALAAAVASKPTGGLSQSAKIGLGVGLGVGIPLLALAAVAAALLARRNRKTQAKQTHQGSSSSQAAYQKLIPGAGRRNSGDGMIGGPDVNDLKRGGSLSGAWEYQDEPTTGTEMAVAGAAAGGAAGAAAGQYGRESTATKSGVVSPITSTSRASRNIVTTLSTTAPTPTTTENPYGEHAYAAVTSPSRPVSPVSPVSAISSISSLAGRQSTAGRSGRRPSL